MTTVGNAGSGGAAGAGWATAELTGGGGWGVGTGLDTTGGGAGPTWATAEAACTEAVKLAGTRCSKRAISGRGLTAGTVAMAAPVRGTVNVGSVGDSTGVGAITSVLASATGGGSSAAGSMTAGAGVGGATADTGTGSGATSVTGGAAGASAGKGSSGAGAGGGASGGVGTAGSTGGGASTGRSAGTSSWADVCGAAWADPGSALRAGAKAPSSVERVGASPLPGSPTNDTVRLPHTPSPGLAVPPCNVPNISTTHTCSKKASAQYCSMGCTAGAGGGQSSTRARRHKRGRRSLMVRGIRQAWGQCALARQPSSSGHACDEHRRL